MLANELDYVLDGRYAFNVIEISIMAAANALVHRQFLAIPDNLIKCLINFYSIFSHFAITPNSILKNTRTHSLHGAQSLHLISRLLSTISTLIAHFTVDVFRLHSTSSSISRNL